MPTTSNFGWTTPADTDLVKDGAAAIRTLGNGIDTSFLDLKGGTTDQVLAKNSNTDLDFKWVAQDDSNAIQNAIVDAKGDLISATAADTPARLAVGTDGQVLTADSTTSTGLKWAAAASASGPAFKVTGTTGQTLTQNTWTKAELGTETFDTDSCYDPTTNYRFTPNKAGYYSFQTAVRITHGDATAYYQYGIYKNGTIENLMTIVTAQTNGSIYSASNLIYFNGSSDYAELYVYTGASASQTLDRPNTFFSGVWIRS